MSIKKIVKRLTDLAEQAAHHGDCADARIKIRTAALGAKSKTLKAEVGKAKKIIKRICGKV